MNISLYLEVSSILILAFLSQIFILELINYEKHVANEYATQICTWSTL